MRGTPVNTLPRLGTLALLALAACGGSSQTTAPIPSVQITGTNAQGVVKVTLNTSFALAEAAGMVCSQLPYFVPGTLAVPGPEGGQVLLGLDDRNGDGLLSTGDVCSLAFAGYFVNGQTLDGAVTIDGIALQGRIGEGLTWILDARINLLGVTMTKSTGGQQITGSVQLRRQIRQTVRIMDLVVVSPLEVGQGMLLAGTTIGRNEYFLDDSLAWFVDGSAEATGVDGLLRFRTETPFSGLTFLPAPYGGTLEVLGQDESRIMVNFVNFAGAMALDVDADGDGDVDETLELDWAEL